MDSIIQNHHSYTNTATVGPYDTAVYITMIKHADEIPETQHPNTLKEEIIILNPGGFHQQRSERHVHICPRKQLKFTSIIRHDPRHKPSQALQAGSPWCGDRITGTRHLSQSSRRSHQRDRVNHSGRNWRDNRNGRDCRNTIYSGTCGGPMRSNSGLFGACNMGFHGSRSHVGEKPGNGLAVCTKFKFPGELKNPSSADGRNPNPSASALHFLMAVLDRTPDWYRSAALRRRWLRRRFHEQTDQNKKNVIDRVYVQEESVSLGVYL